MEGSIEIEETEAGAVEDLLSPKLSNILKD